MMLRSTQLHFAAVILAIAAVSMTAPAARAFTQENLNASGNGSSTFADPDDQVKNFGGQGTQLFGPGGPVVQFGAQQGQPYSPFSPFSGFQGGMNSGPPPEPYARPLGNGD
jgi:hypothetical protein